MTPATPAGMKPDYDIAFTDRTEYLHARVSGGVGDPDVVSSYYAAACAAAADARRRKILVESFVTNKRWTFDDAESIATRVAHAATHHGILAIAVVTHDPASNRDAEAFAVQIFKNIAVEGKYFADDLPAAEAWIRIVAV